MKKGAKAQRHKGTEAQRDGNAIEIISDSGIYSTEAVKLAAFIFSGRADIKISWSRRAARVLVSGPDAERLSREFMNEVLNQQCRLDLAKKNSRISEIIVTRALLSASGESGGRS